MGKGREGRKEKMGDVGGRGRREEKGSPLSEIINTPLCIGVTRCAGVPLG